MSVALELWRALEAWDPNAKRYRIDKGLPGAGQFMPSPGGGGGGKPSLAAVIKGTAANGPKRDRHKATSVAGAVRQAARMSDTTGRPTQRTPEEHRAHGAHDVADEVDRALAEAGVSEEVRGMVSGRARAAADAHGPNRGQDQADAPTSARPSTWEELGKPQGPAPVGKVIGHEGGTYERLPGEHRRYRVISADGRDISDEVYGASDPSRNQTADDARTALRMDAYNRGRAVADATSTWRQTLGAVTGSWSYDTGDIEGFDAASPQERDAIRGALHRWTGDKVNTSDATRQAEPRVNTALRGAAPRTEEVDRDIRALDLALTLSRTDRPITVYRGFSNGAHILPDDWQTRDLAGLEWSTTGFTPTSGDNETAESYAGPPENRGFAIRLKLPKGAPAIAIPDAIGGDDNEGEIVLPRDLKFRVIRDNGAQGDYGIRWLDVELVASSSRPRKRAPSPPKPAPKRAARPKFDNTHADAVVARLGTAASLVEARTHLAGLTVPQLRQVAERSGVAVGSGDTKARALDRIVNSVVGRRLDSEAIGRIVRG